MLEPIKKITFQGIRDAAKSGYNATVIINCETYELDPSNDDFINGLEFAAAYIIDNRARRFFSWTATQQTRKAPKKELEKQQGINQEARFLHDCILHLAADPTALDNARTEYNLHGFWGL